MGQDLREDTETAQKKSTRIPSDPYRLSRGDHQGHVRSVPKWSEAAYHPTAGPKFTVTRSLASFALDMSDQGDLAQNWPAPRSVQAAANHRAQAIRTDDPLRRDPSLARPLATDDTHHAPALDRKIECPESELHPGARPPGLGEQSGIQITAANSPAPRFLPVAAPPEPSAQPASVGRLHVPALQLAWTQRGAETASHTEAAKFT